jgi:aspartyl/glutamyl-tRNA(Asn/Gln) amidotransferase C subunit
MDAIDDTTLERMLELAAVAVPDDARERLREDLGRVLESMDAIAEAPLDELPPTYGVAHGSRTRPDEPVAGLDREAALAAAPKSADDHFVLPSAMGRSKK